MKIDRDAPIGVFDSGVGGLTVAREMFILVIQQGFLMEVNQRRQLSAIQGRSFIF